MEGRRTLTISSPSRRAEMASAALQRPGLPTSRCATRPLPCRQRGRRAVAVSAGRQRRTRWTARISPASLETASGQAAITPISQYRRPAHWTATSGRAGSLSAASLESRAADGSARLTSWQRRTAPGNFRAWSRPAARGEATAAPSASGKSASGTELRLRMPPSRLAPDARTPAIFTKTDPASTLGRALSFARWRCRDGTTCARGNRLWHYAEPPAGHRVSDRAVEPAAANQKCRRHRVDAGAGPALVGVRWCSVHAAAVASMPGRFRQGSTSMRWGRGARPGRSSSSPTDRRARQAGMTAGYLEIRHDPEPAGYLVLPALPAQQAAAAAFFFHTMVFCAVTNPAPDLRADFELIGRPAIVDRSAFAGQKPTGRSPAAALQMDPDLHQRSPPARTVTRASFAASKLLHEDHVDRSCAVRLPLRGAGRLTAAAPS